MDVDECDFAVQLEDERSWLVTFDPVAWNHPHDVLSQWEPVAPECAPTEVDSTSEQGPDLPMVSLFQVGDVQPEEETEPMARAAPAISAPSGPVREHREEANGVLWQDRPAGLDSRVRLRGQQRAPLSVAMPPFLVRAAVHYWGCLDHARFTALSRRDKLFRVFKKMRWWAALACRRAEELSMHGFQLQPSAELDLIRRAGCQFRSMTSVEKGKLANLFVVSTAAPAHIMDWVRQQWPEDVVEDKHGGRYFFLTRSLLLTWNGDWGLFPEISGVGREWREVVEVLRENARFQQLWRDFRMHCERLADLFSVAHHACSMEVCMDTLTERLLVRVLGHACFNHDLGKVQLYRRDVAAFMGTAPRKSIKASGNAIKQDSASAGSHYVCAPKNGSIVFSSSQHPYNDFQVNADRITNSVQADKMEFDEALRETVWCSHGFTRSVGEPKASNRAKHELALREHGTSETQYYCRRMLDDSLRVTAAAGWPVATVRRKKP